MPRHFARLTPESAVKRRLPTARLRFGKIHLEADALQHFGHRHPDFWKQLVDDAGDKQRDPLGHESQIVACATISIIDMRDALLRGLVVLGVCVALVTETLGALHWLRWTPLAIAWILILIAAIRLVAKHRKPLRPAFRMPGPFDWLIAACLAAVSVVTLITALVSPPN